MQGVTAFQRDLLFVIAGLGRPHGLAVKDELGDYYQSEIQHGRLYPNLDSLVEMDLVEKGEKDRRTNYYTLTDEGEQMLQSRRSWENQYLDEVGGEGEVQPVAAEAESD